MQTENKRYTTLLFDADGTLLDFDEAERRGVRSVMRSYGAEPTDELVRQYHTINQDCWKAFERGDIPKDEIFRRRYPLFFSRLGITVDAAAAESLYRKELDACAALIPGALELCEYLRGRYDLYIITNGVSRTQYTRLHDSGLDQYFDDVFVSEDAGSQKPQKEYFDYCLARIREKALNRMLVIGDSLTSDIRGGINAGIDTCWVNLNGEPASASIRPDYTVDSLEKLKAIL